MPLVSIVIPLHNKAPYIEETIQSVSGQTFADWEMIIVENGSNDGGPDIVRKLTSPRISLIIAPNAVRGPGAARNLGLECSQSKWAVFLDADDLWEPDYLENRLSVLDRYPDAEIIAGPWKNFSDIDRDLLETQFPDGWSPPFGPPPASIYGYSPWALHAALVRRAALGTEPWLPDLDRTPAEDNAFWFRVLFGRTIHWNDCAGALYRKQTSNSRDESARDPKFALKAIEAMLTSNRDYLKNLGRRPSGAMAATAVRMLENLLGRAAGEDTLKLEIRRQINSELADTSCLDPAMLLRRMGFQPGKNQN